VFQRFLEVLIDGIRDAARRRLVYDQRSLAFTSLLLLLLLLLVVRRHLPSISVNIAAMGRLNPRRRTPLPLSGAGLLLQALQFPLFPETRPNIVS